jgi:hypothetical protein
MDGYAASARALMRDCFERFEWAAEEVEAGAWRASFTAVSEREYDLYVIVDEEWLHFGVSPLVTGVEPACRGRLWDTLLRLNQQARLVYFAVDEDDDVNLLVEYPAQDFTYTHFTAALNQLTAAVDFLAEELQRLATDPAYHSPRLPGSTKR